MRESPESLILPPSPSLNAHHNYYRIGEASYPSIDLELCDNCKWSCTCLDTKRMIGYCPLCGTYVSHIPVAEDEACFIKLDDKLGLIIEFSRKTLLE